MAPWSLFAGSGSEQAEDLPESMPTTVRGVDTAFEVFIDGALAKVYNEASGRSKEQKALRTTCKKILGTNPMAHLLLSAGSDMESGIKMLLAWENLSHSVWEYY